MNCNGYFITEKTVMSSPSWLTELYPLFVTKSKFMTFALEMIIDIHFFIFLLIFSIKPIIFVKKVTVSDDFMIMQPRSDLHVDTFFATLTSFFVMSFVM